MKRKLTVCSLVCLLLSVCCWLLPAQDVSQAVWYPVSSWEIQELTRLYSSSQSSKEQALQLVKKLQQTSAVLNESLNLERERTRSLQKSFDAYRQEAQSSINRQAVQVSQLTADKAAQKIKNQKLITVIVIESSVLFVSAVLAAVGMYLKFHGV